MTDPAAPRVLDEMVAERARWAVAPVDTNALASAIVEFQAALPGWWFSLGTCGVSRDASCAPDMHGPDAHLLEARWMDSGFHADLRGERTMADALRDVMRQALEAKAAYPKKPEGLTDD